MKKKISFVAVGQAAGNIGKLFEQKGYAVIYVNTSQEDLDTLEKAKFKYHIPQGEGCNKDRRKAKQLVIDDFDNIAAEIESKVKADMIFVIFASGGGTGSGAGPMLIDLLIDEGKTGFLFEAKKKKKMTEAINRIDSKLMSQHCLDKNFDTVEAYCTKLTAIYNS